MGGGLYALLFGLLYSSNDLCKHSKCSKQQPGCDSSTYLSKSASVLDYRIAELVNMILMAPYFDWTLQLMRYQIQVNSVRHHAY